MLVPQASTKHPEEVKGERIGEKSKSKDSQFSLALRIIIVLFFSI